MKVAKDKVKDKEEPKERLGQTECKVSRSTFESCVHLRF